LEKAIASTSIGILLLGLLFVAGGFGTFVAGHMEGLLVVFVGVAMLWAGWIGSQAKGLSCLIASFLNTLDASITLASWNYEVNPLVLASGPTLFIAAKMLCSVAIVLFARMAPDPRKGGRILAAGYALILSWNLGQLAISNFQSGSLSGALFWGSASSVAVALVTLIVLALLRGGPGVSWQINNLLRASKCRHVWFGGLRSTDLDFGV
jgi:hypothetical protein